VALPARRWTRAEVEAWRDEGGYRLETGEVRGWLDGIGRAAEHPQRLPERYGGDEAATVKAVARFAVEWAERALADLETRPEALTAEVQALRIGDAWLVASPGELFARPALELRRRWPHNDLLIVGCANDSIGSVPDAAEVERGGWAAVQSPKLRDQLPFTAATAPALVEGMLAALEQAAG
jgi:hypothetical protein